MTQYVLHFAQPWWLLTAALAVPAVLLSWRNLEPLGRGRQVPAAIFRTLVIVLLATILSRPEIADRSRQLTLIAVVDRSQSIPTERPRDGQEPRSLLDKARGYVQEAARNRKDADQLAVVDVAEFASISQLPSTHVEIAQRNTSLLGMESKISSGIEMGLAIAPPNTSVRMLLVSDGNETAGDLKEAARIAAANGVPIDVLPIHYEYKQEVVFQNLVAPVKGRSGQTIPLRFVLHSTGTARGQMLLSLNGKPMPLGEGGADGVGVELRAGTNVKTLQVPLGAKGMHEFRADFIPADSAQDSLEPNNHASAITFVAGPGFVTVVDQDSKSGDPIVKALKAAQMDVRRTTPAEFAARLAELADCDAVVLADTECSAFSLEQQEMLVRYVGEMGGGLVMTGGPQAFGAGGWIGSPVADILPVDLDPPQKKQMPKGALVLIMHACEMPQGNGWSKKVAEAAVGALSRLDLAGILEYGFGPNAGNGNHWVCPLSEVGDKSKIFAALKNMQLGDMPSFQAPMQEAYDALKKAKAGQKHVILISDGDPGPPTAQLLKDYRDSGITCTGVTVFPHDQQTMDNLKGIAAGTGGRYHNVDDPRKLPQIFIKEAQIVRRSLIQEEKFTPAITSSVNEIVRGVTALPPLDGYVLTGPRGGLNPLVMAAPTPKNEKGESSLDPILATGQHGLGRTVAFTSSADSRWAQAWMGWGGFDRFWEQVLRYAAKSSQAGDLEVFADVQGRAVTLTVESVDSKGQFVQFSQMAGQVIAPDMTLKELSLSQVGPGRYRANFQADSGGCYLVVLQYKLPGSGKKALMHSAVIVPYAPEFRDLTDNAALLAEVAHITGGRVIKGPPDKADLFSRAGVRIPQAATPLAGPLMLAWLAMFLLDVAIRRIAVDFAAIGRRVVSAVTSFRRPKVMDATLDRLKNRRQEFLDALAKKKKDSTAEAEPAAAPKATAARRYEAKPGTATEIDTASMEQHPQAEKSPLEGGTPPKPEPLKPAVGGSLQQLLDAKKRAKDKLH